MSKFLVFLISIIFSITSNVQARMIKRGEADFFNEKAYSVLINLSRFQTGGYFDNDGNSQLLTEGSDFNLIQSETYVNYELTKDIELGAFFRARSVSSNVANVSASSSGPESVGVSGRYALPSLGKIKYALRGHYNKTLYHNSVYATALAIPKDEVILGDDGSEFGFGLAASFKMKPWVFDGVIDYVSPPNDLSSEIQYKIEGTYFFESLSLFGGLDGIYSLNRNQLSQKPFLAQGSSNLFNSLNRQLLSPYLGASYLIDSYLVSFKGSTVLAGRSTDKGNTFLIALSWNSEGISADQEKIESFKEYNIEGSVLKISARGNFVKIDQGLSTDVEKGMKFDIYQTNYFGGNVLVASGTVFEVGSDWSVIKITKKYGEIEIKPGFAARGK